MNYEISGISFYTYLFNTYSIKVHLDIGWNNVANLKSEKYPLKTVSEIFSADSKHNLHRISVDYDNYSLI